MRVATQITIVNIYNSGTLKEKSVVWKNIR